MAKKIHRNLIQLTEKKKNLTQMAREFLDNPDNQALITPELLEIDPSLAEGTGWVKKSRVIEFLMKHVDIRSAMAKRNSDIKQSMVKRQAEVTAFNLVAVAESVTRTKQLGELRLAKGVFTQGKGRWFIHSDGLDYVRTRQPAEEAKQKFNIRKTIIDFLEARKNEYGEDKWTTRQELFDLILPNLTMARGIGRAAHCKDMVFATPKEKGEYGNKLSVNNQIQQLKTQGIVFTKPDPNSTFPLCRFNKYVQYRGVSDTENKKSSLAAHMEEFRKIQDIYDRPPELNHEPKKIKTVKLLKRQVDPTVQS